MNLISQFSNIVGINNALISQSEIAPFLTEHRDFYHGKSSLVLQPTSTEQISNILKLATKTKTPIIPIGGNTGLVGGQASDLKGKSVLVSLSKMNKIYNINSTSNTALVESGVILQALQSVSAAASRLFPLSLGSQGSAQIGGLLSSNAGGTAVLAYGTMRQLCLGLEVVLPNGEIMNDLKGLTKDNTGYDLKNLFIGAEGTLGIITKAVLKLFPKPRGQSVAFIGVPSPKNALELLNHAHERGNLTGFELIARLGIDFATRHIINTCDPLPYHHPWYVLAEMSSLKSQTDAQESMETFLSYARDNDHASDTVIAKNETEAEAFWSLRENLSYAQKPEGGSIKHDISIPISAIPTFIEQANKSVNHLIPNARFCTFGHMGDGNIHYNISQPIGADKQEFLDNRETVNQRVYAIVDQLGGSISAEHGIGQLKRAELQLYKDQVALSLMQRIKETFDPENIMNPNKIL
jgi:FAD/FMN-containing dehydrogenase